MAIADHEFSKLDLNVPYKVTANEDSILHILNK